MTEILASVPSLEDTDEKETNDFSRPVLMDCVMAVDACTTRSATINDTEHDRE